MIKGCKDISIPVEEVGKKSSELNETRTTQQKIHEIMEAMKDLLLYKNQKYGDSAINPKKIFYKGDSTNSILIRLDDKIGRVKSNTEDKPRVNDVCDIIGYCTLLLISMNVKAEDIEIKNSQCEFMGVSYDRGAYRARIGYNHKKINLGSYKNLEDAIVARLRAEKEYFGEFAPQRDLFEKYGI